jgi:hypothetical protein
VSVTPLLMLKANRTKQMMRSFTTHSQLVHTYELEEFSVGHKHTLLSHKVIHNSCLGHSQILKNTKKSLYQSHPQFVPSSFISRSQTAKTSVSIVFVQGTLTERKGSVQLTSMY